MHDLSHFVSSFTNPVTVLAPFICFMHWLEDMYAVSPFYSHSCESNHLYNVLLWKIIFVISFSKGETILTAKKWMLSIEGRVVIPPAAHLVDFTTALAALFACYYVFNLEYQVEASTTLEFVQRYSLSHIVYWKDWNVRLYCHVFNDKVFFCSIYSILKINC